MRRGTRPRTVSRSKRRRPRAQRPAPVRAMAPAPTPSRRTSGDGELFPSGSPRSTPRCTAMPQPTIARPATGPTPEVGGEKSAGPEADEGSAPGARARAMSAGETEGGRPAGASFPAPWPSVAPIVWEPSPGGRDRLYAALREASRAREGPARRRRRRAAGEAGGLAKEELGRGPGREAEAGAGAASPISLARRAPSPATGRRSERPALESCRGVADPLARSSPGPAASSPARPARPPSKRHAPAVPPGLATGTVAPSTRAVSPLASVLDAGYAAQATAGDSSQVLSLVVPEADLAAGLGSWAKETAAVGRALKRHQLRVSGSLGGAERGERALRRGLKRLMKEVAEEFPLDPSDEEGGGHPDEAKSRASLVIARLADRKGLALRAQAWCRWEGSGRIPWGPGSDSFPREDGEFFPLRGA